MYIKRFQRIDHDTVEKGFKSRLYERIAKFLDYSQKVDLNVLFPCLPH